MANFTQRELDLISATYADIQSRMNGNHAINPNDKPIADGYAMMARLLKDRLASDSTLTEAERTEMTYVMTWFQGAEKVNRGEGSFSTMIRTYSDVQGKLRYGSEFGAEKMQEASNKIGINAFSEIEQQAGKNKTNPVPLLNMKFIADKDATGVGKVLFDRDTNDTAHAEQFNSAWSGVSLFSVLGSDQTYRILGSGKRETFDTLTDLRDSMFLVESFRYAFNETFKGSVKMMALATALAGNVITRPLAEDVFMDIVEELGMFASRDLVANFYTEITNYTSTDFDIVSTNAIEAVADAFLLAMISGNHAYNDVKLLIKNGVYDTLETLQKYYDKTGDEINHENFINNAHRLFNSIPKEDKPNQLQWAPTTIQKIQDLALQDNDLGLATRYALSKLDVVILTGFDFNNHNQNGELKLYSKDNPVGMSQEYIAARSEMLQWKQTFINTDTKFDDRLNTLNGLFPMPVVGDYIYKDINGNLTLDIDGVNPTTLASHYKLFGSDKVDTLTGGELDDKIFANQGNDTLIGNSGNDYLEGGQGFDTYHITDHDTLFDSDGKGQILFNGKALPTDFILKDICLGCIKTDRINIC